MLPSLLAASRASFPMRKRTDCAHSHVIGLNRQNACRCVEELLVDNERRGTVIGGHADILHEHPTQKEIHLAGERIEVISETRRFRGCRECSQVNRRSLNGLTTKCLASQL